MDTEHIPATRMAVLPMPDGSDLVLYNWDYADRQHLKREVVSQYRRNKIATYTENADLLPEEDRKQLIREAFVEAEKITLETLPLQRMEMPKLDEQGEPIIRNGVVVMEETEVTYIQWWLSQTEDGMLFAVWLAARHAPGQEAITRAEIWNRMSKDAVQLEAAAQEVGKLSQSDLAKNSSSPDNGAQTRKEPLKETEMSTGR